MEFSLVDIIGILIIYQSLLFVMFLLFKKKDKPIFIKILVLMFILISFHFVYMLSERLMFQKTYFMGPFFGLIYGPLYYIYTKSLILERLSFRKNAFHFLPAFIIFIFLLFAFNKNDKLLSGILNMVGLVVTVHFIAYLLYTLKLIFKYRKLLKNNNSSFYNISLFWLEIIIYVQLLTLVVTLFESYFQSLKNTDNLILIIYALVLLLVHCFYYLGLKQVRLFKGFDDEKVKNINSSSYTISNELFDEFVDKLAGYMDKERPYLEFDLSLNDLSDSLSISTRNLSYVINKKYKKNFFDFINSYRLDVAKNLLTETTKPIKEVMYESGYANKATFNAIFKKNISLTPSKYRENHKS